MSNQFPHQQIDSKWREIWKEKKVYKPNLNASIEKGGDEVTKSQGGRIKKDKYYALVALPYPSGSGLHVGHMYCFNPVDILARYQRMIGKEVILPIGWDSFGLPAENFAVKAGVHPKITTDKAIENFKWQLELAGFSTDFETHELAAHWENYYKWTQWIFLQLYKDGLAYRGKAPVNWCPSCQTVLANEQVENGKCERCENLVEQKDMEQWFMKITNFSERLYQDLDKVDWPESTKAAQRNWIGRSEGAEVDFQVVTNDRIASLGEAPRSGEGVKERKLVIHKYNHDLIELANQKRKELTDTETAMWSILKGDKINGYDWTRQKVIGNYIVDFYCNELELVLEIDGKYHDYTNDSDEIRQKYLENEGIKVIRIANEDVIKNWSMLDSWLINICQERNEELDQTPSVSLRSTASQRKQYLESNLRVFTTRPDTIYGATFMVIAPEHKMLGEMQDCIINDQEVMDYIDQAKLKSQLERESQKEKTGVEVKGIKAINPITKTEIPIFVADYVLNTYGTGAIMAVPAHDERDGEFAKKYGLESIDVIEGEKNANGIVVDGKLINSDILNGMTVSEAKKRIIEEFEKLGIGNSKITYRLRDWLISRQRYWGCPIPMVYLGELKIKNEEFKNKSFSYLMGTENIPDQDLKELEISFNHKDSKARTCIISNSKLNDFKNLIKQKLSNGFWNEVISENEIWFCFKDKTGNISEYILSKDNYNEILAKCNEYVGSEKFANIYDMLIDNEFYKEYLIREIQAIDEKYLPLKLPTDVEFKPTGESPIAYSQSYKKLAEELYGIGARFEFDTMDTFIDSSWYYMRYLNANDDTKAFDSELCNAWLPTDLYMIGPEHTVLHLMYSRFFTKYFFDKGMINYDEPFYKMRHQGMIAGADGRKMSKRYGNVINPSDICEKYGADTLRVYEMFMGPLEQGKNWSEETVVGVRRFIDRIWNYAEKLSNKEREIQHSEKAQEVVKEFKLTFEPIQESEVREIKRIQVEGWYDNNVSSETGVDVEVLKNIQGMVVPDENTDLSRNTKILTDNSNGNIHLAIKSEGKVIGWLGSFIDIDKDNLRKLALYIDREYRSKGIGSVAMEVIINKANYQDLYLEVVKSNPAVGLYKKFGFIEIGEDKYMLKDNVHYLPLVKMVRYVSTPKVKAELQKLVRYVTENIPALKFNTCVAEFMKFQNLIETQSIASLGEAGSRSETEGVISINDFLTYMKVLAPFAPFITDEIYNNLTNIVSSQKVDEQSETEGITSIHQTNWPTWDDSLIIEDKVVIGVQVNGKLRGEVEIEDNDDENSLKAKVMQDPSITKWLEGKEVKKFIYIKGKIVSIVV